MAENLKVQDGCLFCRIVAGEIPADKVYESESVLVFRDIHPKAPQHALVIPRSHITSLAELAGWECEIFEGASESARRLGIEGSGYRVVLNQGDDAGQEVAHIHFHVLGGRRLTWPPG